MTISRQLAQALIALERKLDSPEQAVARLTRFLERRDSTHLLPDILAALSEYRAGEERSHIETGHSVSDETLRKICSALEIAEASYRHTVNPDLIGGFRVLSGGRMIDGSVRRSLEQLRERLRA